MTKSTSETKAWGDAQTGSVRLPVGSAADAAGSEPSAPGEDSGVPPGWSYNPSAWSQRLWIIGAAVVGFVIAGYLALFQYDVVDHVWDPLFGAGSERVLTSSISRALPVSDATLGAFGYLLDAVSGAIGGTRRWRKMPWIVILFGLAVGPLGLVSVLLVILQPLAVGSWCLPCLITALISTIMIGPAMDEVLASAQYLKRETAAGRPFWPLFWGMG